MAGAGRAAAALVAAADGVKRENVMDNNTPAAHTDVVGWLFMGSPHDLFKIVR